MEQRRIHHEAVCCMITHPLSLSAGQIGLSKFSKTFSQSVHRVLNKDPA